MSVYADSSFFVSFYLQDGHAAQVNQWMVSQPSVFFTPFHRVELVHAVFQHVFRRLISRVEAQVVLTHFGDDCARRIWREVDVPAAQYERAVTLAERHVATLGTRTLDTLHVAAALELGATAFWSFDQRQTGLAQAAGLTTN